MSIYYFLSKSQSLIHFMICLIVYILFLLNIDTNIMNRKVCPGSHIVQNNNFSAQIALFCTNRILFLDLLYACSGVRKLDCILFLGDS